MSNFKNLYEQLNRMTELINYNNSFIEKDYFIIYEGLIKTTILDKARILLERWFLSFDMSDRGGDNLQIRNVTMDNKYDTLTVNMLPFQRNIEKVKEFLKYVNNLGYYISMIYNKKSGDEKFNRKKFIEEDLFLLIKQYNNLERLYVILEAKFDIEIDEKDWSDKLYHVTRQDVLHKIKKIGLSPRSESKLSTHPERIYFGKTYDDAYDIVYNFKKEAPEQKFAILEIDTKLVKHIRVFDDPNYKGYGYYILVNVPPNAIKILNESL